MRDQVIDSIKGLAITGIRIANELPYDESGAPVYFKNPKTFYVDRTQFDSAPVFQTLNGVNINNTTESVTVYLTIDAKTPIAQLDDVINNLRTLEDTIVLEGAHTRECIVSTDYANDLLTVTVEYRLTRIN